LKISRTDDGGFLLYLSEVEAGELRCTLDRYEKGLSALGIHRADWYEQLLNVLLDIHLPEYENRYPQWRKEKGNGGDD
jgi:hypothetical protein